MRRRVARGLRGLLFVLGVALLIWIPLSYLVGLYAETPSSDARLDVAAGSINVTVHQNPAFFDPDTRIVGVYRWEPDVGDAAMLPYVGSRTVKTWTVVEVMVPLWMLGLLCLAWPLASFIRGKNKRGFPIEPRSPTEPHG